MRRGLWRVGALIALTAACWRDPVALPDTVSGNATLYLQVAFVGAGDSTPRWHVLGTSMASGIAPAGGTLVVWGRLEPGRDRGLRRRVLDSAVVVGGVRFKGRAYSSGIEFGGAVPMPPDRAANRIVLPTVEGVPPPPILAVARIERGIGPATTSASGVGLPILSADSSGLAGNTGHSWQGWVTQGGRTLEVTGSGLLSPRVILPRWDGVTEPATVRLLQRSFAANTTPVSGVVYAYSITSTSSVRWAGLDVFGSLP